MNNPFSFHETEALIHRAIREAVRSSGAEGADAEEIERNVLERLPSSLKHVADVLRGQFSKTAPGMLRRRRRDEKRFCRHHAKLWGEGLDLFETLLVVVTELGAHFNSGYRATAAEKQDYGFEAMTLLHSRACQVGHEVLLLLSHGFADGAHARWRTLHEIAVTGLFIASAGPDAAERYLQHEVVASWKGMSQYQAWAGRLGQRPFDDVEVQRAKLLRDAALERYGRAFGEEYGWAANALETPNPKFADLERAVNLEHFRPYFRLASQNVHAGIKGTRFRLGLGQGQGTVLLAGPSTYGLTDPGHGAAISLAQVTGGLLGLRPNIDTAVYLSVVSMLVDEIGSAFIGVHQGMEKG